MKLVVFLMDKGGDLMVFASVEEAVGWMEAIDVEAGEYPIAFMHDGTVLRPVVSGDLPALVVTDAKDKPGLAACLDDYRRRVPRAPTASDPLDFANEWLRQEWQDRWPRRPLWLARRVHGEAPQQIRDDAC